MINTEKALQLVLQHVSDLPFEEVSYDQAIGRVLAEDIYADRAMPPFNRVAMDGIAIQYAQFENGQKDFQIEGTCAAGSPQMTLMDGRHCIEIMTGASLPKATDTVIRYEDLTKVGDAFRVEVPTLQKGQNIHRKGSDHEESAVVLAKGTTLKAIDINVLATVGKTKVKVRSLPRVAVISSGDELVDVDQTPAPYQIRKSNVYMIAARLRELGMDASIFHFKDEAENIYQSMKDILSSYDVLLMSGGVSKGKFDFIPSVLERLGFKKTFHRVAQRPGKPFWFGHLGAKTVFAFPGNPVSTLACFHKYFVPWLNKSLGQTNKTLYVKLANEVVFKPDLTYFAQASLEQRADGYFYATVRHGNGSGDIVNPTAMDGFIELPPGKETYAPNHLYVFLPFHPLI